jgi:hypothetical protein
MADLSARLIHQEWSVTTIHDSYQMDTKLKYFALCGLTTLFILSVVLLN